MAAFISSLPDGGSVPGGTRVPFGVTQPRSRPMLIRPRAAIAAVLVGQRAVAGVAVVAALVNAYV
jgi:hypothetical protein